MSSGLKSFISCEQGPAKRHVKEAAIAVRNYTPGCLISWKSMAAKGQRGGRTHPPPPRAARFGRPPAPGTASHPDQPGAKVPAMLRERRWEPASLATCDSSLPRLSKLPALLSRAIFINHPPDLVFSWVLGSRQLVT